MAHPSFAFPTLILGCWLHCCGQVPGDTGIRKSLPPILPRNPPSFPAFGASNAGPLLATLEASGSQHLVHHTHCVREARWLQIEEELNCDKDTRLCVLAQFMMGSICQPSCCQVQMLLYILICICKTSPRGDSWNCHYRSSIPLVELDQKNGAAGQAGP